MEHALLEPLAAGHAIEVRFWLDYEAQFDQAGLFLRVSDTEWRKAGVEVSDGVAQVGAVAARLPGPRSGRDPAACTAAPPPAPA